MYAINTQLLLQFKLYVLGLLSPSTLVSQGYKEKQDRMLTVRRFNQCNLNTLALLEEGCKTMKRHRLSQNGEHIV